MLSTILFVPWLMLLLVGQEACDRVILVSSPTHLPRCLRDACSLWLDPQHKRPPTAGGAIPTAGERAEDADAARHRERDNQGRAKREKEEEGGEKERTRPRRRRGSWLPLVLASPSDTSFAEYGPGDVAIVEPPHRGDTDGGPGSVTFEAGNFDGSSTADGASVARDLSGAEEATPALLMLHDLVALALRVGKSSEEGFRKELQELLLRYVDKEDFTRSRSTGDA